MAIIALVTANGRHPTDALQDRSRSVERHISFVMTNSRGIMVRDFSTFALGIAPATGNRLSHAGD
jgi:hypothetical protein